MSGAENLLLDTNLLVYSFDHNEPVKSPAAHALLMQVFAAGQPLLTIQVLSEFYWNVTRKIPLPLSHAQAVAEITQYHGLARVVPVTWDVLAKALDAANSYRMSLWDAQLLAAAVLYGATILVSEDFQHRRTIEGVTFINPFAPDFAMTDILTP